MRQSRCDDVLESLAARTPYPLSVNDVDLAAPLVPIRVGTTAGGHPYAGAVVTVRLHTRPLGFLDVAVQDETIQPPVLANVIWGRLRASIVAHCLADGITPPASADDVLGGLGGQEAAPCLSKRRALIAAPPDVTVVIATRDRTEGLRQTLATVQQQAYPRFDMVVVDNAPTTDDTARLVADLAASDQRLRYVREDRPGLGWAHCRGLAEATGEIVAFTDDDVHVDRHWLAGLLEGFAAAENVGCVTGLILPRELETPSQVWYEQYGGFAKGFERRIFDLESHRPADPLFPFTVGRLGAGASMAFSRSALEAVGGFDPALGPGTPSRGGEDIDAFFKILTGGWRLVYEPAALAYHTHRRDFLSLERQLSTWGIGYSAFLTAAVISQPGRAIGLLPRVPAAILYALRLRSRAYRVAASAYPESLTHPTFPARLRRAELRSLPAGPWAYLRGRAQVRARRRAARRLDQRRARASAP